MDTRDPSVALYEFIEIYANFFEEVCALEQEKLAVLRSGEIPQIQQMITRQQAIAKRMENIEGKRMALQQAAGMAQYTFKEILAEAPAEDRARLKMLFDRIRTEIANIKYLNEKSMVCARTRLQMSKDPQGDLPVCGYSRQKNGRGLGSLLIMETKA